MRVSVFAAVKITAGPAAFTPLVTVVTVWPG